MLEILMMMEDIPTMFHLMLQSWHQGLDMSRLLKLPLFKLLEQDLHALIMDVLG